MASSSVEDQGSSSSGRKLRVKERRLYTEEFPDEEIENTRLFSVEEKLTAHRFANINFVKEMKGEDITIKMFQENGFSTPILVKGTAGLGMKIPDKNFNVDDVRQHVGNKRMLDVVDVNTQTDSVMTMKDWCKYWETKPRDRMLNVISLEFTHTKLETMIESPAVVRNLDWVEWVWPKHLTESHTEATNVIGDMLYPKVRKYVLMSVEGCYTDFHIDFGGTSVWYHILYGKKVFWLIPPSEKNIQLFEQWVLSGKQSDIFFGDLVDQCSRVYLEAGDTFFIPSGYIHSVYTPADSLVFGGNFLHSYAIEKQLRVAQVEDTTRVKNKFRYPFYIELHWYLLERYVHCLTGKTHLVCKEDGSKIPESDTNGTSGSAPLSPFKPKTLPSRGPHVHLTSFEVTGLKAVIMWLSRLPPHKRHVPELILQPDALLNDAKILVDDHAGDEPSLSVTGRNPLTWKSRPKNAPPVLSTSGLSLTAQLRQMKPGLFSSLHNKHHKNSLSSSSAEVKKSDNNMVSRPSSSSTPSVTNFAVKPSSILNEMPSAFNDLIAATGASSSSSSLSTSASLSVSPSSLSSTPVASLPSTSTPTRVVLNASSSGITSSVSSSLLPSTPVTTTFSTQMTTLPLSGSLAKLSGLTQNRISDSNNCLPTPYPISVISDQVVDQITPKPILTALTAPVAAVHTIVTPQPPITPTNSNNTPNGKCKDTPPKNANDSSRRRRTRCKKCEACVRSDCGDCHFCKDMRKFGGPGRMKQSCITRQCLTPVLPHTACCMICGRDGWEKLAASSLAGGLEDNQSSLMECSQCWEILHPVCLKEKHPSLDLDLGRRDDLPNSWECPKCVVAMKSLAAPKIIRQPPSMVVNQRLTPVAPNMLVASGVVKQERITQENEPLIHPNHQASSASSVSSSLPTTLSASSVVTSLSALQPPSFSSTFSSPVEARIPEEKVVAIPAEKVVEKVFLTKQEEEPASKKVKIDHEVEAGFLSQNHDLPPSLEVKSGTSHDSSAPIIIGEESFVNSVQHDASQIPTKQGNENDDQDTMIKNFEEKKGEKIKKKVKKDKREKTKNKKEKVQSKNVSESGANGSDSAVKAAKIAPLSSDKPKVKSDKNSDKKTIKKEKKSEKKETLKDRLFRSLKTLKKKSCKIVSNKKNGKGPLSIRNDSSNSSSAVGSPIVSKVDEKDELSSLLHEDSETDNETMDTIDETNGEESEAAMPVDAEINNFMSMYPNGIGLHGRPLVFPRFVVRPAPLKEDCSEDEIDKDDDDNETDEEECDSSDEDAEARRERRKTIRKHLRKLRRPRMTNLAMQRDVIFPVLRFLDRNELLSCSAVCKPWNAWTTDPSFWDSLSACGKKVTPAVLTSIVKRQPKHLDLSWTNVSYEQMEWLLPRIPQLQSLSMAGCSASAVTALCSSNCPLLKSLDVSWIDAFNDDLFRELMSSPADQRPGLYENKTRLRNLQELNISGSEVTDTAIRIICSTLPHINKLHLSNCSLITDIGIAILSACSFADKLKTLLLYSCERLTDQTVDSLAVCPQLTNLDLRDCPLVTCTAFIRFFQLQSQKNQVIQTHNKCMKEIPKPNNKSKPV